MHHYLNHCHQIRVYLITDTLLYSFRDESMYYPVALTHLQFLKSYTLLKVLAPKRLILLNSLLCFIAPFSSLYAIIFLAICELRPDTYCNNDDDAVLTSTTWLTAVSTTKVNAFSSAFD